MLEKISVLYQFSAFWAILNFSSLLAGCKHIDYQNKNRIKESSIC